MSRHGLIVERPQGRTGDFAVVCPHFAGLTAMEAMLAGALPIGDANAATLALAGRFTDDAETYAAILAADPFRPPPLLLPALREAGVRAVINLPSLAGIGGGLAAALHHAGADYAAELATLVQAKAHGFQVMAVAGDPGQAGRALASGLDQLLICPRPELAADASVAKVLDTVRAMRAAAPSARVLVFRPPMMAAAFAPAVALADGVADWAIVPRGGAGSVDPVQAELVVEGLA